jgi:aminobenzoyl-glutamate utilization protein B
VHCRGHNVSRAGSLDTAVAIIELIVFGKLKVTIRFYGTPAKEVLVGKVGVGRAGLFNDLAVCLDWGPDYENTANMQT